METNPMRMHLQKILPLVAGLGLIACEIPGDGKTDVKGTVIVSASVLADVMQPDDDAADGDCTDGTPWGEAPVIGDVSPTVYIGLYPIPVDPRNRSVWFEDADNEWRQGCGEFDLDGSPATPPDSITGACPVGGTTATFVTLVAGSNGGAEFEFNALNVDRGQDVYLVAWLDNRCRADNRPTSNLVWDLFGPPSTVDETQNGELDPSVNDFDIISKAGAVGPLDMSGSSIRLDEPVVLDTALSVVGVGL